MLTKRFGFDFWRARLHALSHFILHDVTSAQIIYLYGPIFDKNTKICWLLIKSDSSL